MRQVVSLLATAAILLSLPIESLAKTLYDFEVKTIDGKAFNMKNYEGKKKAYLIVNTASECGYTSQYSGLQKLHETYKDQGLVVMGFPSNDFGGQEPGKNEKIKKFCKLNYGVNFPLFSKGPVKGKKAQPLFQWLTKEDGQISWNFEKFLVDSNGKVIKRFRSGVTPESDTIKNALTGLLTPKAEPSKEKAQPDEKKQKKAS